MTRSGGKGNITDAGPTDPWIRSIEMETDSWTHYMRGCQLSILKKGSNHDTVNRSVMFEFLYFGRRNFVTKCLMAEWQEFLSIVYNGELMDCSESWTPCESLSFNNYQ